MVCFLLYILIYFYPVQSEACHCLPASMISSIISTYSEQYFSYIGAAASWNRSFSLASSSVTTHPALLTLSSEVFSRSSHSSRSYRADFCAQSRIMFLYSSGSLSQVDWAASWSSGTLDEIFGHLIMPGGLIGRPVVLGPVYLPCLQA